MHKHKVYIKSFTPTGRPNLIFPGETTAEYPENEFPTEIILNKTARDFAMGKKRLYLGASSITFIEGPFADQEFKIMGVRYRDIRPRHFVFEIEPANPSLKNLKNNFIPMKTEVQSWIPRVRHDEVDAPSIELTLPAKSADEWYDASIADHYVEFRQKREYHSIRIKRLEDNQFLLNMNSSNLNQNHIDLEHSLTGWFRILEGPEAKKAYRILETQSSQTRRANLILTVEEIREER